MLIFLKSNLSHILGLSPSKAPKIGYQPPFWSVLSPAWILATFSKRMMKRLQPHKIKQSKIIHTCQRSTSQRHFN